MWDEILSLTGITTHFENCRWEHLIEKICCSISCLPVSIYPREVKKTMRRTWFTWWPQVLWELQADGPMWNIHFCIKWPKLYPVWFWCWKIIQKLIHSQGVIILTSASPYPCRDHFSLRTHQVPSIRLRHGPSRYFAGFEQVAVAESLQTVKMKKQEPLVVRRESRGMLR